jgi:hypothetical protein
MQRVRILKSFRGYRTGESVVVSDDMAAVLIGRGVAVLDGQAQMPLAGTAEESVLGREVRTATIPNR